MTETIETPPPEPESRQVRRARERKQEKDKKRKAQLAGAPIKKVRRNMSLRGNVQLLQRTIAGMLLELRNMVADWQQKADLQNILNECLARHAIGQDTEEDRQCLAEYLDDCDQARKDKAEAEQPSVQVEGPPAEMGESVFGADVPTPGPADAQAG